MGARDRRLNSLQARQTMYVTVNNKTVSNKLESYHWYLRLFTEPPPLSLSSRKVSKNFCLPLRTAGSSLILHIGGYSLYFIQHVSLLLFKLLGQLLIIFLKLFPGLVLLWNRGQCKSRSGLVAQIWDIYDERVPFLFWPPLSPYF